MKRTRRIIIDPTIMGGKPVITGTRVTVEHVLELMSGGWSEKKILEQYPHLKAADLRAVIKYAAGLAKNEHIAPLQYEAAR